MEEKTPQQYFEENLETIKAIDEKDIINFFMPEEEMIHEANRVTALVENYREQLLGTRLTEADLDILPAKAGALAFAVANFMAFVKEGVNNKELWQGYKEKGYDLRSELLDVLEYVFYDDPAVLRAVAKIKEGRGDLDMTSDLLAIFKLGADRAQAIEGWGWGRRQTFLLQ